MAHTVVGFRGGTVVVDVILAASTPSAAVSDAGMELPVTGPRGMAEMAGDATGFAATSGRVAAATRREEVENDAVTTTAIRSSATRVGMGPGFTLNPIRGPAPARAG